MKKSLIVALLLVFTIYSCKKEDKANPSSPSNENEKVLYPIQMNVSDFIQQVEHMPQPGAKQAGGYLKDSLLHTKVSHIIYKVFLLPHFDYVRQIRQSIHQNPATFGTIRDSLPAGDYAIIIFAAQDSILSTPSSVTYEIPQLAPMDLAPVGDIYAKLIEFTVSPATTNVVENVTLNRSNGKIEVNVLDGAAIESNNQEIEVTAHNLRRQFSAVTFKSAWDFELATTTLSRKSATKYEGYILDNTGILVTITVKDKTTGTVIATRNVSNVTVGVNQRTSISGNVTGANTNSNSNWDVLLNQAWNTDINIEF
ncbi:hypothetical protein [Chitinophaga caseinilytica]|uniref:hypothetical protein n=1 Tax=Chitinophaga caseinilytica TaxID=2267521 RepID=UPI003C2AEB96